MKLFDELSPEREAEFRLWARENYKPLQPISGLWHPIVQDECRIINSSVQLLLPPATGKET